MMMIMMMITMITMIIILMIIYDDGDNLNCAATIVQILRFDDDYYLNYILDDHDHDDHNLNGNL